MTTSLIDINNFKSLELKISGKNHTTGVTIPIKPQILLIEIGEQSFVLEIPKRSCAQNHLLTLKIEVESPNTKKQFAFDCTAKVTELMSSKSSSNETTDEAHCELVQFEEKTWLDFRAIFSTRQDEITEFLSGVKGY